MAWIFKITQTWLPVRHRINFKIATITFKVLQFHGMCRRDHCDFLLHCHSVPNQKTGIAKSKSFSSVASIIWNKLPGHLSSISTLPTFRKRLKHHLFLSAFPGNPSPSTGISAASCFVMSAHPQMQLRSDTPHHLANMFQLSTYD